MAGRRRNSFVQIATNPLELKGGLAGASASAPRIESLADAMPILADEFGELVGTMKSLSDNEARLAHLEEAKKSYLFSSEQLLEILGMTPSIKTKISMIGQIGPRLMDPKAKHDVLVDMFVYAEQKKEVEDILKARAQHLLASAGAQPGGGGGIMLGGRGGRGRGAPTPIGSSMTGRGRGGPGRGPMISRPPTNPKQESSGTSDEAPLPIPPTASIYPLSQSVPKRRPSSAQLALEGAGFEANVIESGVGQLKLLNDRSSPAVASIDGASPGPIQDPVDFDEDLKNKSEERLRVTAVRRSSKIDDWMQNMKSKGSNDIMESSSPSELPQEDNEEGDDVFEDPVVPPPARRATKRLSVLPLALDRSESNGFPSFEEQKSFESIAKRRPSITKTRTKEIISYDDLMAIVESKEYGSLSKTELEEYLSDEEFKHCFQIDREMFRSLPNWRKQAMKKTLRLF